jgi:polyribonucleotide nucleotidyltransferase
VKSALIKKSIQYGEHTLTIETGVIARQATGSVLVDLDGTTVLVTVVGMQECLETPAFFALRVDYQEKDDGRGKIPGGYFKREGRPSEREILISRLIDRPIRPLFPEGFMNEVQVIASVKSLNPQVDPDIPAMIGASAALAISGIPFAGPMAAAKVGYKDGCYILNPTVAQLKDSKLELVVAGTNNSVLMVESKAQELSEDVMLGAVMFGHQQFQAVIKLINELQSSAGKTKWEWQAKEHNATLKQSILDEYSVKIAACYEIADKIERKKALKQLSLQISEHYIAKAAVAGDLSLTEKQIGAIVEQLESDIVRQNILAGNKRIDGRDLKTIRPIEIQTGLLSRTHGSALFTRGETQAVVTVTLGTGKDAQIIDNMIGEQKENFMLHYNFPPYCVGEIGQVGSPKRREIGHGWLAKRGIEPVLPSLDKFPYVLRIVSDITESNGSSSMASVCGGSLALMDAGVPIKSAVAGIAMGLIKEGDKFVVISDILGDEDHLGDMDFKVVGTSKGVTALQMDIKIDGITEEIMSQALEQAREGRMHILKIMQTSIAAPRANISQYAPKVIKMSINPQKIKDVIGKGGATIRSLIEDANTTSIDITEDGNVQIVAPSTLIGEQIREKIESLTAEVEVGKVYSGKVVKLVEFGAFVNILPGQDGLVHVSQIAHHRVENVANELKEGQPVKVKVLEIDKQGRLKLSIKACLEKQEEEEVTEKGE